MALLCLSQKISPVLLSSSGGYNKTGNISMHWAIGEVAVSRYSNNSITLNEGFYQGQIYLTSSEDISLVNIKIYPNPATSQLYINDPENQIRNIYLINLQGRDLNIDFKNFYELNISDVPSGVYFLKVVLKSNSSMVYRVVKI